MSKRSPMQGSSMPARAVTTAPNSGGAVTQPVDTTAHKAKHKDPFTHQHGSGSYHDQGTAGSGHAGGMGHGGTVETHDHGNVEPDGQPEQDSAKY